MNKLKAIMLAACAALVFASAGFAQQYESLVKQTDSATHSLLMKKKYFARAGVNSSSVYMGPSSFDGAVTYGRWYSSRFKAVWGIQVGGGMDKPLAVLDIAGDPYVIAFNPGLQFVKKGGKKAMTTSFYTVAGSYNVAAYYLEAPLPFSFKKVFSPDIAVRADLGPFIALGVLGSQELKFPNEEHTESSFSESGLSRLDLGAYYGTTVELIKKFTAGLHVGQGFTDDETYAVYLSAGYMF